MATQIYRQRVESSPGQERKVYEEQITQGGSNGRYSGYRILYFVLDILEVLLAARLFLRLLAANPNNAFVSFIYQISAPFIAPFRGAFPVTVSQGTVIEWSTVLAMIVYAIIAYIIVRLIGASTRPNSRAT